MSAPLPWQARVVPGATRSRKLKIHKREPVQGHPLTKSTGLSVHRVLCGQVGGLGVMSVNTWQHVNCKRCLRYMGT